MSGSCLLEKRVNKSPVYTILKDDLTELKSYENLRE